MSKQISPGTTFTRVLRWWKCHLCLCRCFRIFTFIAQMMMGGLAAHPPPPPSFVSVAIMKLSPWRMRTEGKGRTAERGRKGIEINKTLIQSPLLDEDDLVINPRINASSNASFSVCLSPGKLTIRQLKRNELSLSSVRQPHWWHIFVSLTNHCNSQFTPPRDSFGSILLATVLAEDVTFAIKEKSQ